MHKRPRNLPTVAGGWDREFDQLAWESIAVKWREAMGLKVGGRKGSEALRPIRRSRRGSAVGQAAQSPRGSPLHITRIRPERPTTARVGVHLDRNWCGSTTGIESPWPTAIRRQIGRASPRGFPGATPQQERSVITLASRGVLRRWSLTYRW